MYQKIKKNRDIVDKVFNSVYDKYDIMNDIMSFGAHRIWKKKIIKSIEFSIFN